MPVYINCKKERKEGEQVGPMREVISRRYELICEGCQPELFQLLKYGKPLTIQRPSQEKKNCDYKPEFD